MPLMSNVRAHRMPEVIAEYELVGRHSGGEAFPVSVRLCKPVPSAEMSPAWACSVTVDPLWSKPFLIYGEGSFQALCLAAKHAVQMLDTFVAQGGVLQYADGELFEPELFGFKLLPREQ
jgi:hypothetical protein